MCNSSRIVLHLCGYSISVFRYIYNHASHNVEAVCLSSWLFQQPSEFFAINSHLCCMCELDWESCEWAMLPLILSQGSHPLYRHTASCCVAVTTVHTIKGQATLLLAAISCVCLTCHHMETKTQRQMHLHWKAIYTHLLCFCSVINTRVPKQQHKLHYCNTRDHPVTGLYDQLSHAVIQCWVTRK